MRAIALALLLAGCATVPLPKHVKHSTPVKITRQAAQEHIARRSVWDRFWQTSKRD